MRSLLLLMRTCCVVWLLDLDEVLVKPRKYGEVAGEVCSEDEVRPARNCQPQGPSFRIKVWSLVLAAATLLPLRGSRTRNGARTTASFKWYQGRQRAARKGEKHVPYPTTKTLKAHVPSCGHFNVQLFLSHSALVANWHSGRDMPMHIAEGLDRCYLRNTSLRQTVVMGW